MVVGDVIAVQNARKAGLEGVLITSGYESIDRTIAQCRALRRNISLDLYQAMKFKHVVDNCPMGTLVFDREGHISYSNLTDANSDTLKIIELMSEQVDMSCQSLSISRRIGDTQYYIQGRRIDEGYAFYVSGRHTPSLGRREAVLVEDRSSVDRGWRFTMTPQYLSPVLKAAGPGLWRAASHVPVMIVGPAGSGQEATARYLYINCPQPGALMITICCELLTEQSFASMADDIDSPLSDRGHIVYLRGVELLPSPLQRMLYYYICDTGLDRRHTIISSGSCDLRSMVAQGRFDPSLYRLLCARVIALPPLGERGDIEELIRVLLRQYSAERGGEVVGLEPEAMALLCGFDWELNAEQLEQTVRQLVLSCDGAFITAKATEQVLSMQSSEDRSATGIDLTRTLDEIERDIIERVLISEHMNQTAAAKRLGVSRSTLWRKLR